MLDIRTIKKIGNGIEGTTYLIKYNDDDAVAKVEKVDIDNVSDIDKIENEVSFAKKVSKHKNSKYFLQLESHMYMNNCNGHVIDIPYWCANKCKKTIEKKNSNNTCSIIIYTPVMERSLNYFLLNSVDSRKENVFSNLIYQVCVGINTIRSLGYVHYDLHSGNIMYYKNKNGYEWRIIDYGKVIDVKSRNYSLDNFNGINENDLLLFTQMLVLSFTNLYVFIDEYEMTIASFSIFNDKTIAKYPNIKKYVPKIKMLPFQTKLSKNKKTYVANEVKKICILLLMMLYYPEDAIHMLLDDVVQAKTKRKLDRNFINNVIDKCIVKQPCLELVTYMIMHCCDYNVNGIIKKAAK